MLISFLKGLSLFFSAMPLRTALAFGRGMGWLFGSVIRYHRRDAAAALQSAFPGITLKERHRILKEMYRNLGMNIVEEFRLQHMTDDDLRNTITWEGEHYARETLAAGKGMIVLSAHLGNWDILCTIAPKFNYPATIITKKIKNEALNRYWMETRMRFGLKFVPAHNSYSQCLRALRKQEIVGFILDQNMIRDEGVFVDFFGTPACTSPGLAYMSAQSGAPVVPVFIIRGRNGTHTVKMLPPMQPPPDRKPETILDFTQRYTRVIEEIVRAYPDQWIWIHRRWRTRPPAGTAAPSTPPDQQSA